jgi:RNA polymerase sigma-70 factor (ECF subfamily)
VNERQHDAELLEAWRRGDTAAGEQLFERHADVVARFFRNKVRNDAEELVQQTFVRLVEGRERLRDGLVFRSFMLGIARNVLHEHIRQRARGRALDPEVESMADLDPGPATVAGRRQEHRLLLEGLRRLPIEHQVALELFYWEGLNAAEIAPIMGVSHSAMRSRLVKARALLAAALESISSSKELLASTVNGLEAWATQIRDGLG